MEAAQLLRRFHDLTRQFELPADAEFLLPLPENMPQEVICHNDFAPYNLVFKDEHINGLIDFDAAAPGASIWDVAYAVYRFAPLVTDAHCTDMGWTVPPDRAARLKLFLDTYGLPTAERANLIDTIIQRIHALIEFMNNSGYNRDHLPLYLNDIAYLEDHRDRFTQAITMVDQTD